MGEIALPEQAFDIEILRRDAGHIGLENDHGWVFGMPRGISTEQWPLDPVTGFPLMHGFTLLLPPEYRCHGTDIVGFSFFATPSDQSDGGAETQQDVLEAVKEADTNAHPRMTRMKDVLAYGYAIILLNEDEINGATPLVPQPAITQDEAPEWLDQGAAAAYISEGYENERIGGETGTTRFWNRSLRWSPRTYDPNAGKVPMDDWDGDGTASGYVSYFDHDNDFEEYEWAKDFAPQHIGGTMKPVQATPEFSPFYIEFEEYFGGYNFGTGNAQLDFRDMKFDWAC